MAATVEESTPPDMATATVTVATPELVSGVIKSKRDAYFNYSRG